MAAESLAAVEFGKAAPVRPTTFGKAIAEISSDPDAAEALFELLEPHRIIEGKATLTLVKIPV